MSKPAPFDFTTLDIATAAEVPFEFELEHPESKEGHGVFLSVIGAESGTFQGHLKQEGNRARKRAFEGQRKGKNAEPPTVEEDEEAVLKALAICIKGWRTGTEPVIVWGADRLECTPDNAFRWLKHFRWVREQVNKATGELTNFLPSK